MIRKWCQNAKCIKMRFEFCGKIKIAEIGWKNNFDAKLFGMHLFSNFYYVSQVIKIAILSFLVNKKKYLHISFMFFVFNLWQRNSSPIQSDKKKILEKIRE